MVHVVAGLCIRLEQQGNHLPLLFFNVVQTQPFNCVCDRRRVVVIIVVATERVQVPLTFWHDYTAVCPALIQRSERLPALAIDVKALNIT